MTIATRLPTVIVKRTLHENRVYFRPARPAINLMRWLALESARVYY
ncbi:MAG: hypothetical protein ABI947_20620 [Chloroflexota bacterium]